ncbi:MAG: hypothetical protein JNM17_15445 [Archangium sp.]|nr:hypothetical protein [Archangium sp.]
MSRKWTVWIAAMALLSASAFGADEPERPWARGVPKDRQTRAIALFREGNAALKESLFPKAAGTYREALQVWDHPAIHYNLALALVNLDQPIEVHEHLTAALKFGAAPLDDDKFQQAQRYLALIERQLTKINVSCSFEGAQVRLDGKPLFIGPGKWEGQVRAGAHTLTASKEGLLPDERSLTLVGGDSQTYTLKVFKTEELTEYKQAFSSAVPWGVLGAGVAAVGAGVGMHLAARGGFQQYDTGVANCAADVGTNGACLPSPTLQAAKNGASGLQTGAYVMYGVGGAALATSAILFYVGRPIAYRKQVNVEAGKSASASQPPSPTITVLPILSPSVAGAMATLEF